MPLIGRDTAPDERRVRAGSLSATLSGLDLLDVRVGGVEVIRRLCVRVRDTSWGTIPPAMSNVAVEESGAAFAVTFNARHVGKDIDFAWQGQVTGDAHGSLEFAMEGEAWIDCTFYRIGLIVLHPPNLAQTASIEAGRDGDRHSVTAPHLVAPVDVVDGLEAPLVPAFSRLSIRYPDGFATTFAFTGDLFEMEDQRNWGDGSFKTFSTPLSVPLPLHLKRKDRLRQALRFGWSASPSTATPAGDAIDVSIGDLSRQSMPSIGLSIDADRHVPTPNEAALIRSIRPAHLLGEIDLVDERRAIADIRRCKQIADSVGAPMELACIVPAGFHTIDGVLRAIMAEAAIDPSHLAFLPADGSVTPPRWLERFADIFGSDAQPTIGTRSDFVELNRRRPPSSFAGRLVYAASAQVHDSDEAAIVQALEGQAATVETARSFAPAAHVHVAPITLKPWRATESDPSVDERQGTLFAAAWLMASAMGLASAGANTLTYFECTGPRGVLSRQARGAEPTAFSALHVLGYLNESIGAPLVSCASSDRTKISAHCLRRSGAHEVVLVNLMPQRQAATVRGLPAGMYQSRILTPAGFVDAARITTEAATVELPPYATVVLKAATG